MHIVIMGCGRVGSSLARSLERRGHSVAVIDQNPEAFRRLGPDFHGRTVKGVRLRPCTRCAYSWTCPTASSSVYPFAFIHRPNMNAP